MYPTPMYRAAISRTALPTALAGMTPPVCAARAGVGAGGGGGGSAVTVIATVSKVQVAPAGTCTTGAVVRAIRAVAVSALVSTAGTSGLLVSLLSGAAVAATPVEHSTVPAADPTAPTPTPARAAQTGGVIPASAVGSAVLEIAARYIGVGYIYGGSTPDGFDCSGFTSYVFAQLGITLSRSSAGQRDAGTVVPADQAQPGDLMWWSGHVAIYAGGNLQIDSSRPGTTIQFREIHRSNPVFIRVG